MESKNLRLIFDLAIDADDLEALKASIKPTDEEEKIRWIRRAMADSPIENLVLSRPHCTIYLGSDLPVADGTETITLILGPRDT
jgi:hypothetical protein